MSQHAHERKIQEIPAKRPRSQSHSVAGKSNRGQQTANLSVPKKVVHAPSKSAPQPLPAIAEDDEEGLPDWSGNTPKKTMNTISHLLSAGSIDNEPSESSGEDEAETGETTDGAESDEDSDEEVDEDTDEDSEDLDEDSDEDSRRHHVQVTHKNRQAAIQPTRKKPGPKPKPKPVPVKAPIEDDYDPTTCRTCSSFCLG